MRKLLAGLLAFGILAGTAVEAQTPVFCPTRPPGDNTNACASTAFVIANGGSGGLPALVANSVLITSAVPAAQWATTLPAGITLPTPTISGGTASSLTGLSLRDLSAAQDATITFSSNPALSAPRELAIDLSNANRSIDLNGSITIGGTFTTAGAISLPGVSQGDTFFGSASGVVSGLAKDTNATRYLANTGTNNNPAWAQVNLTNGVTGDLPFSSLAQIPGLSVLGVTGASTADVAGITGTANQVLRVDAAGTGLTFGAINLASGSAVTGDLPFSSLAQGSALSVLGVAGNATADNASIAAASDNQVLRRSGTAIGFGAVNLGSANAITGDLPFANLTQIAGTSVLGVTGASLADVAAITAGSDGHVLKRVSSSSLTFGFVDGTNIRMGSDTQGDVLFFNGTNYARLGPGASGQVLQTQGPAANPIWATVAGVGDVTAAAPFGADNRAIRSDGTGKGVQSSNVTIDDSGNLIAAGTVTAGGFELVTANRTYFVRTDGNDANSGLVNSAGGAWATWQRCADVVDTLFIPTDITVTCQAGASGTWTVGAVFNGFSGAGQVAILGDSTTPANVIISSATDPIFQVNQGRTIGGGMNFTGFSFTCSVNCRLLRHEGVGQVQWQNMRYGSVGASSVLMQTSNYSSMTTFVGTHTFTTTTSFDVAIDADAGFVNMGSAAFTVNGGVTLTVSSGFVRARFGGYLLGSTESYTVTGTVNGPRYRAIDGGFIVVQALGETRFPGNANGTVERGGSYDGKYALVGTTLGTNANAGEVGQVISATRDSGSAESVTTGVANSCTSVSLTAGDWDVSGIIYFVPVSTTTVTVLQASISQTDNTQDTTVGNFTNVAIPYTSGGITNSVVTPIVRKNFTSTTSVFIVGFAQFGVSTVTQYCALFARRVR